MSQNTLELAKQGDPAAIAIILSYHLSQRSNTTASAIRLGNYLSVLIDASCDIEQTMLVNLVLSILRDLKVHGITIVELNARKTGDHNVRWNQTIELTDPHPDDPMTSDLLASDLLNPELVDHSVTATPAVQPASTTDEWDTTLKTIFQKPELVALLAFALILVLWDSYAEWMQEFDATQSLSGVKLARRLGVSSSTLSRVRKQDNFSEWSQQLDPEGIAWKYENQVFVPQTMVRVGHEG